MIHALDKRCQGHNALIFERETMTLRTYLFIPLGMILPLVDCHSAIQPCSGAGKGTRTRETNTLGNQDHNHEARRPWQTTGGKASRVIAVSESYETGAPYWKSLKTGGPAR